MIVVNKIIVINTHNSINIILMANFCCIVILFFVDHTCPKPLLTNSEYAIYPITIYAKSGDDMLLVNEPTNHRIPPALIIECIVPEESIADTIHEMRMSANCRIAKIIDIIAQYLFILHLVKDCQYQGYVVQKRVLPVV